jgi:hypothetical protein
MKSMASDGVVIIRAFVTRCCVWCVQIRSKLKQDYLSTFIVDCQVWPFAQALNFRFVNPLYQVRVVAFLPSLSLDGSSVSNGTVPSLLTSLVLLQSLVVNGVCVGWNAYLSFVKHKAILPPDHSEAVTNGSTLSADRARISSLPSGALSSPTKERPS